MRGSAARGAASLLLLWASLAVGPGRAHASGAIAAPAGASDVVALLDTVAAVPGGEGTVEGRPIARVEADPRGIFDPVPPGRLAPFFRLADRLHLRTRPSTIRHHMLLRPGDAWTRDRARESERALRALDIFDLVRVDGRPSGDSVVVTVLTGDAWTTSPEFALERGGGQVFGSIKFSERNLFGRAQQIGLAYREDPTGVSRSIFVADPGVGGTRVRVAASASEGSSGTVNSAAVGLPFYAEDARLSFGITAERANTTARLFGSGAELASFARRLERVEISMGRGKRFDRTIARLTGSYLVMDRSFGGSVVVPGAPVEFTGGEERLRIRRVAAEGLLWRPAYVERIAVDQLEGVEDFDLGRSIALTLGVSPRAFGGSADEGFAALRMDIGADAGRAGFGWLRLGYASRLLAGPREATGRIEARWVNQSLPRHTLVLAVLGSAGWRTARDFQLVVGGLNGLRAHGVHALTGNQLWRCNAESRWVVRRNILHLMSLGAAGFWDSARTWGPGSGDVLWQHDIGAGLRVGFPHSALNRVARFDVAWPIVAYGPGRREAVFSFGSSQAF